MQATISNVITATAAFSDKAGNPTTPASAPTWTLDNASLATIAPSIDGLTAVITPVGPVGVVNVTVAFGTLTGTLAVDLAAGAPAAVTVTAVVA